MLHRPIVSLLFTFLVSSASVWSQSTTPQCNTTCQISPYASEGCYAQPDSSICLKYRLQYCSPAVVNSTGGVCQTAALVEGCDRSLVNNCGTLIATQPTCGNKICEVAEPDTCPEDCYFQAYETVRLSGDQVHMRCPGLDMMKKYVIFTFDDGPSPVSNQLLDFLKNEGVQATFFVVGLKAIQYPDILLRMQKEGHIIAQHTYYHVNMTQQPFDAFMDDAALFDGDFSSIMNFKPRFMRPPYGAINVNQLNPVKNMNFEIIAWNIDGKDYANLDNSANVVANVNRVLLSSSGERHFIYLSHDLQQGSLAAFKEVYNMFVHDRGFEVTSLDNCLYGVTGPEIWSTTRNLVAQPVRRLIIPNMLDDTVAAHAITRWTPRTSLFIVAITQLILLSIVTVF